MYVLWTPARLSRALVNVRRGSEGRLRVHERDGPCTAGACERDEWRVAALFVSLPLCSLALNGFEVSAFEKVGRISGNLVKQILEAAENSLRRMLACECVHEFRMGQIL